MFILFLLLLDCNSLQAQVEQLESALNKYLLGSKGDLRHASVQLLARHLGTQAGSRLLPALRNDLTPDENAVLMEGELTSCSGARSRVFTNQARKQYTQTGRRWIACRADQSTANQSPHAQPMI